MMKIALDSVTQILAINDFLKSSLLKWHTTWNVGCAVGREIFAFFIIRELGWFKPNRVVPKYLKNFGKQFFSIFSVQNSSVSKKFLKNLDILNPPKPIKVL